MSVQEVRPRGSTRRFDQEVEPGRFDQKIPPSGWIQEVRHRDSTKDGAPREFLAASPGAQTAHSRATAPMTPEPRKFLPLDGRRERLQYNANHR